MKVSYLLGAVAVAVAFLATRGGGGSSTSATISPTELIPSLSTMPSDATPGGFGDPDTGDLDQDELREAVGSAPFV